MNNPVRTLRVPIGLVFAMFFFSQCTSVGNEVLQNKPLHNTDTVTIKQMQFNPADLLAKIGDTIIWFNNDLVDHNVKEEKNNLFYSDTIKVGNTWKWVVTGSADYLCTIHPSMRGKITVSK